MTSRFTGAIIRAALVVAVLAMPASILIDVSADTKQMVTLAAILLGIITFAEYNAVYPSLVEFRDAAPYNRLRFTMLASTLAALSVAHPATILPEAVQLPLLAFATQVGSAMDFPFSPSRLVMQLASEADNETQVCLRNAAGLAYIISLLWLAIFAMAVRIGGWPSSKRPLNIWINLPMFDPMVGRDVVLRLARDGRFNILVGFALPFVLPVLMKLVLGRLEYFESIQLHSLIWVTALWAFVPAAMILRGIALLRIAELIVQTRAAHGAKQGKSFAPA